MIVRADIERSKSNITMNASQKHKSKLFTGQQAWAGESDDRKNR